MNSTESHLMNRSNELENHHTYVRKRTRATAEQLAVLEDTFAVNVSPNSKLRKQLAEQLSMSERSIQIWFQNRRAKVKHMQKRAQMQMQQAAIRAQLYHYHQQQHGMMSPYGTPGLTPQMIPLHYQQQQQQQQQQHQTPLFFPPPYISNRIPLPRAQSVDAVSYYGNQNDLARSSFPTPGPEPFMPKGSATPPPPHMVPQHQYNSMANWSISPNYPLLDNSTRMSRQSMPPSYNPLSHTLVDDITSNDVMSSNHPEFGTNDYHVNSDDRQEDFPDFVHGQMSPSPSPNREDLNTSSSYFNDSEMNSDGTAIKSGVTDEPASTNESDTWISSSPNIESTESIANKVKENTSSAAPPEEDTTINSSNLVIPSSSLSIEQDGNLENHCFNATTLTIGTWRRLKFHSNDLICLYKPNQQAFMWFITEGGSRFKVEFSLTSLVSIEYTPSLDNNGESTSDVHFYMSQPPLFYMESPNEKEGQWIQCSDFTENKQASRYLRHTLQGSQLKQDLLNLMNDKEDLRKFIRFLDPASPNTSTSSSLTTPLLPSQQQQQQNPIMVVPSASFYPVSSYYCYPNVTTASMPLSLSNNSSLVPSSEPPVFAGGFYA